MDDMYNIEHAGLKITIEQDQDVENPRTDYDHLGKMVCFHRRYNLGDKHEYSADDYSGWGQIEKAIVENEDVALIVPVYLYDHSSLRMKIGSFRGLAQHAEWDSGQVGFAYVTKAALRKELNVKRIGKKEREYAERVLKSEVEVYDQFLSGDVYCYSVHTVDADGDEDEDVDSCCGMYGYNYCLQQAKEAAESYAKRNKPAETASAE